MPFISRTSRFQHSPPITVSAKPIAANLWDIFVDAIFYVRVTYHGDSLVRIKTKPRGIVSSTPATAQIEAAIMELYNAHY